MELSKRLILACLLLAFWAGTSPVRAQEPVPSAGIHDLKASFKQDVLKVSYTVEGAFTPAVQERLVSASTIRFVHRIRVLHRRPLFFGGRVLAERNIETSVRYDNLTRQYALTKIVDGAPVESTTTESEQEMRRFMTEIEDFDVAGAAQLAGEERVTLQVRAEYEETWLLFLFPYTYKAQREKDVSLVR